LKILSVSGAIINVIYIIDVINVSNLKTKLYLYANHTSQSYNRQ